VALSPRTFSDLVENSHCYLVFGALAQCAGTPSPHNQDAVRICSEDLALPMGAELLVVPSLIGTRGSEPWLTHLRARALENRLPIISPNICLPPRILGKSCILDLRYDKKEHVMQLVEIKAGQLVKPLVAELNLRSNKRQREERLRELLRSKAVDGLYAASRSAI
jgi:predicted amidohydrolase